ncbi:MAG: hypothetical protein HOV84_34920 [Streptomyces sp.]|nr:hypothetical protein [Streptomyces sp.]
MPVHPWPGQAPAQPVTAPERAARRRGPGRAALLSVSGTSLAGALVLVWWLLPFDGDSGKRGGLGAGGTSSSRSPSKPTAPVTGAAPAAQQTEEPTTGTLLTPDAIRTVIKAFEKETGRDRFGDFTVYPEYASAWLMVNGSDTKYDSYTYRPGQGVQKSIISGTLPSTKAPLSLDGYKWDRVPALFEEADKKLNVDDPENRYLMVKPPSDVWDTPAGMAVYLSGKYNSGYLETDTQGNVTRVMPAED